MVRTGDQASQLHEQRLEAALGGRGLSATQIEYPSNARTPPHGPAEAALDLERGGQPFAEHRLQRLLPDQVVNDSSDVEQRSETRQEGVPEAG